MLPRQMQGWPLLLQCGAVPLPQLRRRVVGALRKVEEDLIRLFTSAHRVVRQDEFAQFVLVEIRIRLNFRLCESKRFRIGIRIEEWRRRSRVAGPKTEAAYFLTVGLARDRVRQMWNSSRMRRRWPSGETRHCQIKTAPEKMHRTAFAAETRAKFLKYASAFQQDAPKPICIFWIVGSMLVVLIEWNRGFNLVRRRVDRRVDLKLAER